MQSEPQKQGKKPYHKPRLDVYGDVLQVTKTGADLGMFDNLIMKT